MHFLDIDLLPVVAAEMSETELSKLIRKILIHVYGLAGSSLLQWSIVRFWREPYRVILKVDSQSVDHVQAALTLNSEGTLAATYRLGMRLPGSK
ncbi:MAG: hypothetical protein KVP17_001785 [Porospora cf. gigantea B]|uniref:uncharacterized protein n=1 Tax=Porospora cf. gigantea B TaxID=2853592 RepID=UPI003571A15F|nr:MAG: hypothetical protein KVP17_001785 [Porospora cf. gigantea B]